MIQKAAIVALNDVATHIKDHVFSVFKTQPSCSFPRWRQFPSLTIEQLTRLWVSLLGWTLP